MDPQTKNKAVLKELEILSSQVALMYEQSKKLNDVLSPILRAQPPECSEMVKDSEPVCQLANDIMLQTKVVSNCNLILSSILGRLEI
jgi:hypothetical protein